MQIDEDKWNKNGWQTLENPADSTGQKLFVQLRSSK